MRKKPFLYLVVGVFLSTILILTITMWSVMSDYNWTLQANWDIALPRSSHYSEVYYQKVPNDEYNLLGDGVRYHVFTYKKEQPIAKFLEWKEEKRSTRTGLSYRESCEEWLDEIEVPSSERPAYSDCLYWYQRDRTDEIIILWNQEEMKLYIVESFF